MRDVFGDTLSELARQNPSIVVLDADLANSTKADKFAQAHPDRFLEMGIAEQNMVGTAVGMATLGFVPWLSSFTVFFTHRALDPVRMLVAQTHANVKIGAAYSGLLTGYTGKTHQDVEDLAIMRAMPGMTVLAPADEFECAAMIRWATDYVGPVYLRLTRDPSPAVFGPDYGFKLGAVHRLREGSDLLMISTGPQSSRCVEAAQQLENEGISAAVLHVPSIKPLRQEEILSVCEKFDLVFTVEEHSRLGGLGGLVTEILSEYSPRQVLRVGLQDEWGESAPNDFLLDKYGLSAQRVAQQIASKRKRVR
ncbi:MAG TPA: transketolase C-terminal domain-containing protein [Chthoniobacterales bacterium]|nr:transketolase C-terminal domain-containing protein [Chthoniobacterales bacterium]